MTVTSPPRGHHLLNAGRSLVDGSGRLARLASPGFRLVLDRLDAKLPRGRIETRLPDGSRRVLGGRGDGPTAEVEIRDWRALLRLVIGGSAGWYRAWAAGEWSSPDPVPLFELFTLNREALGAEARARGFPRLANRALGLLRRNTRIGARRNIAAHYDLGNDFYATWLDPTLTYSSAIWGPGDDLEAAQRRKIGLLLDRLALAPGGRVLEIGCGWGSLAEAAAARGLAVTGITLSAEQQAFARARLAGTSAIVELLDYRDVTGVYDGIASVEMVEAVGRDYWQGYLDAVARLLRPGGRAALQLISIDDAIFDSYAANIDFIQAHIFPGGMLVSERRFRALAEQAGLAWTDRCGYGPDYARTLAAWRARFDAAAAEGRLPTGFDRRFADLWRYYLMYCEGGFRGGAIDVAQVTLVKQ